MYKVMIVDDETIILSGIKSLVDWEENDCELVATARNGQEALEQVYTMPIDIMLIDLNMPVMDGVTLMGKVHEEYPDIVFIVLTNLEEFELARQAMKFRAVDYLVKSRLEASKLEETLARAKEERENRTQQTVVNAVSYLEQEERKKIISRVLQEVLFFSGGGQREEYIKILKESGVLKDYGYFYIPFEFSASGGELPEKEERAKRMELVQELVVKTAENIFKSSYILLDVGSAHAIVLFIWDVYEGQGGGWEKNAEMFSRKLTSVVKNVTQTECKVFRTEIHKGYDELKECANEYRTLLERYYLGIPAEEYQNNGQTEFEPLGLKGIGSELYHEIMQRNLKGINTLMDNVISRIQNTAHQKSQAVWLLNELNREASTALAKFGVMETSNYERVSSIAVIDNISTRKQVLSWLEMLRNTLDDVIGNGDMPGNPLAQKARKYVVDHIEDCISLQETAEYVGVSAGYLSTIFKREYNQSFVDYVNETKMEYACRLLEEGELMVMEIAYRLGYENAYYFSKVFRKYIGMSPTDYQRRMEDEKNTQIVKK